MNIDEILLLLSPTYVNQEVFLAHDWAREKFNLPTMRVRDYKEFKYLATVYVQHHMRIVEQANLSESAAFGIARRRIDGSDEFKKDKRQDPYARALQVALDGAGGGMRLVIEEIASGLKNQALFEHTDNVFYEYIDILSKRDRVALGKAYFDRFGDILRRFGMEIDEFTFANDPRAALDYHREMIDQILGIARKI